ncbi:hypothetical protein L873DRAFT_703722 [Choiromyces venosus 120613-1]|uniref:Yeast cell wall synthesis Kre9/Knh1-like N-terminal domain-containing protein n=1 Tax=Choiromyces venosus 120613-1 TaxID=1336337 RepID=A0A3N4IWM6_9PEZI|nr:hypothetical protein L873DRAFT_703722 [Choiromyces venosus 120613-1]
MRFFTSSLLAIAALASAVFAAENPISKPDGSVPLVAGEPVTVTWTPTTAGPITLKLRQGPSNDLKDLLVVVGAYANSGTFTWTIPADMPSGDNYAFQISDDKTTDVNYTPLLTIKSDVAPKSSSGSSAATSSTSSGSTSSVATTSKPEITTKPAHNATQSTMVTPTTAASNETMTTTVGSSNGTTTTATGGKNVTKLTTSASGYTSPSSTGSTGGTAAPSSGAVSLVMNSPLALVVCVLGAVMYLN